MNKDFLIDYISYILFKSLAFCLRCLPLNLSLFLGRRLGDFFYYFDAKHKAIAQANIKRSFRGYSKQKIRAITHDFYSSFGQNLIEVLLIPRVNKAYVEKYIAFEGFENIREGFKAGKGVIFLSIHAGSWELSNIISAILGLPFAIFVREQQKYKRIENLLNHYRKLKGCRLIQRENQTRQLIRSLRNNEAIGMTLDQGGKNGIAVDFFSKTASMSSGAVRIALKYGATILPVFYTRLKGPYSKIFIGQPFKMRKTGEKGSDIKENLRELTKVFENFISLYPKEYLWTYRIWKYSDEKNILLLNDGKAGHLRQSQAVANIARDYFSEKGFRASLNIQEAKAGISCAHGPMPDLVISCGFRLARLNYRIAKESLAKSIIILKPSLISTKHFDLAIMPRHDNPARKKNIVVTIGALNLINDSYLRQQAEKLAKLSAISIQPSVVRIGLLLGGDTKRFGLNSEMINILIKELKSAAQNLKAELLVTTSRRTPREAEEMIKKEFRQYPACKLLVIANEKNIPEAVGGILGLSQIIVTSPESISMISEAASSGKYVLAFKSALIGNKHKRCLDYLTKNNYIFTPGLNDLAQAIEHILKNRPKMKVLQDGVIVKEAISRIL